jgi:hypothetical protein
VLSAVLLGASARHASAEEPYAQIVFDVAADGRDLAARLAGPESVYSRRIVGLVTDEGERGDLDVVFDGTEHYLPVRPFAALIGAEATARDDSLVFVTPAGEARVAARELHALDGELYVRESTIRGSFSTPIRFDAARYALVLELPWWRAGGGPRGRRVAPEPDRRPTPVALSGIRVDYQYMHAADADQHVVDYRLDGALAEGGWRVNVEQDFAGETVPDEYFWLRAFDRRQVLVGFQEVLPHPLLPSAPFTGGQVLFSNAPLDPLQSYGLTQSDFARSLARPQQDIRGTTQPGAIVELRIDGRVAARARARLDGTYEFVGVELPSRGHADVEVLVFDRSYATLIDRIDYSRSSSELLLAQGHQVFLLGGGEAGNVLDSRTPARAEGAAGLVQWRRGLTDRLTAEAVVMNDGIDTYQQAGLAAALGARWVGALGVAADGSGRALQGELAGFGARWRFDYYGEERGDGYQQYGARSAHDIRYEYRAGASLWLGLRGRHDAADVRDGSTDDDNSFLLPGISWTPDPSLDVRAWPNAEGTYRFDTRYRANANTLSTYSYEDEQHTLELSYWRPSGMEYYTRFDYDAARDSRAEAGVRFALESDYRSFFQAALIGTDAGKLGYFASAEKTLVPGFYASLELRDEPYRGDVDLGGQSAVGAAHAGVYDTRVVQLRLTADLALAGRRLVPADTRVAYSTTGSIAGAIAVEGAPDGVDFDGVTLLVDGHAHAVPSRDGRFYVGNLRPGVYRVRLSQASLPIELTPDDESYWVKVAQGAATRVDFAASVRYGVAGRVVGGDGAPRAGVAVRVLDVAGNVAAQSQTDAFGLYRVDGLRPGAYAIEVDDGSARGRREFAISTAFLFGVDVALGGA